MPLNRGRWMQCVGLDDVFPSLCRSSPLGAVRELSHALGAAQGPLPPLCCPRGAARAIGEAFELFDVSAKQERPPGLRAAVTLCCRSREALGALLPVRVTGRRRRGDSRGAVPGRAVPAAAGSPGTAQVFWGKDKVAGDPGGMYPRSLGVLRDVSHPLAALAGGWCGVAGEGRVVLPLAAPRAAASIPAAAPGTSRCVARTTATPTRCYLF